MSKLMAMVFMVCSLAFGSTWLYITAGAPPVSGVLDTFHGVDGTLLESHTANTGQSWHKNGGSLQILSNVLAGVTAVQYSGYSIDAALTTGTMTLDLTLDTSDFYVIMDVSSNQAVSTTGYGVEFDLQSARVRIFDYAANTYIATYNSVTYAAGAQQWIVGFDGSTITVSVGGLTVGSTSGLSAGSTFWGLEIYNASQAPLTTMSQLTVAP